MAYIAEPATIHNEDRRMTVGAPVKRLPPAPHLWGVISERRWIAGESPAMAYAVYTTEDAAKRAAEGLVDARIEPIDKLDDGSQSGLWVWRHTQPR